MYIPTWLIILAIALISLIYLKRSKIVTKSLDSHLVNLTIEFNVDRINDFIKRNGKITDKSLIDEGEEKDLSHSSLKKTYNIDILPNGKNDIFFHRSKSAFSHIISGYDYFDNSDGNVSVYIRNKIKNKSTKIRKFSWERWREFLSVKVTFLGKRGEMEQTLVALVPIWEIGLLMTDGEFKDLISFDRKREKIKVPISFDSNNEPKEFIEMWKCIGGTGNWITYSNSLVTVSAAVPTACEEEY